MKRYWTADMHLGHGKIIEYCNRPFRDCDHMNLRLIADANMRVTAEDMCVHVGDFAMKDGWPYRRLLHGNWTFLRGNHDKQNKVKSLCDWMFVKISHFKVFVSHTPYFYRREVGTAKDLLPEELINCVENTCDFAICGHVHDSWGISHEGKIPTINVGVDARKYKPMSDQEVLKVYLKDKWEREHRRKR